MGTTLPQFLTPNLLQIVSEQFGTTSITTVEEDMKIFDIAMNE